MFWRKKKPADAETEKQAKPGRPRSVFIFLLRGIKYLCILFFICLLAALGSAVWVTQTESGQAWVLKTVNSLLAPAQDSDGLIFRLTSLSGSIPAHFTFGLEAADRHGVWLRAPDNTFIWNWRELPGAVHIEQLTVRNVDIERLPDLPPSPPPPPSKPLTVTDIQDMLAQGAEFLAQKHWWLPAICVNKVAIADALIPADILPAAGDTPQRLMLDIAASLAFVNNEAEAQAHARLKNAAADSIAAPSISLGSLAAEAKASLGPSPNGLRASVATQATIASPVLDIADIPADFLGSETRLSLNLDAKAVTAGTNPGIEIALTGPRLSAGHINITGGGSWATDETWKDGHIAGPLQYKLKADLAPLPAGADSPLAALKSPASATLEIDGELPTLDLLVALNCAEISQGGHSIKDTSLAISARDVELPLNAIDIHALEKENHIEVKLASLVDRHKVTVATELFFQALAQKTDADASGWRAGLRDLAIDALGLQGTGNVAVLMPAGQKPGLDGKIKLEVKDWADISEFMPGNTLSGDVTATVALESGSESNRSGGRMLAVPINSAMSQKADISLLIPAFAMRAKDASVELAGLDLSAILTDIFDAPAIEAHMNARKIAAADMQMAASLKANGAFNGPIKAEVATRGSVNSRIAAQWAPGHAEIDQLDVVADISRFIGMGKGKKLLAGVRSTQKALISYGEKGISVQNLDLRLLPSGRLQANGGIAPDKLNFRLDLQDFQLKPLQAISAALPTGIINLTAALNGSPARPDGHFRLNVRDLAIPQSPLQPISLGMTGNLEHSGGGRSALKTSLEIDPRTVKTLGGTAARINASIPLLFGADGMPSPDMNGPLAARVLWDGALGPIWNLLPMPDQRLNGRVSIDVNAGGTPARPKITGSASINNGRYENLLFGVLLTDINLKVGLSEDGTMKDSLAGLPGGIKLALSLSDGRGGTVTANGSGALDGSNLDIKARINNLKPLRRRDVHVELSGHAEVSGAAISPAIAGEIIVNKGEVLLDNLAITSSVTTLPITDDTQPAKAKAEKAPKIRTASVKSPKNKKSPSQKKALPAAPISGSGGNLNVKITMLPRFHVEGRGLASVWKANLLVTGSLADPKVSGNISCVRGNFDFLGKNFALTRGVVFFGGGSLSNPLVDIDLTNETPDLTAHILVTGPVDKIKLELTSDPSVPRDEILSRVLFGRSVNDLSRAEALQLAGAVAQLAGFGGGGGILNTAKKALGVDVLRIGTSDTGDEGDNDAGGTNIEMGKYINDYIYMGVQQGLKPDSTAFIIEIELTPRTNLELRTEQNNTWGGLKWKYNY